MHQYCTRLVTVKLQLLAADTRHAVLVAATAGSTVRKTEQSVIDGITAGRKTFSRTIDQGLLLLAR